MSPAATDSFWPMVPGVTAKSLEMTYMPVAPAAAWESSRYVVLVGGYPIGQVYRRSRRSREWGAQTQLAMHGTANPNKIAAMYRRRRDVAIRMVESVLKANPQLIQAAGLN